MGLNLDRVVTGSGSTPLDQLVQQLWQGQVDTGEVRVVIDPAPNPNWQEQESYWVLPGIAHARILVPRADRRVTAGSLLQYSALRPWKANVVRNGLGYVAHTGVRPGLHRLSVQALVGREGPPVASRLPIAEVQGQLQALQNSVDQHVQLHASIGIRTGDNRKPTLQLIDSLGRPAGYAKVAWNESSRQFITTETAVLQEIGNSSAAMRAPGLLCSGELHGFPYLVTAPLPPDVRAVRRGVEPPTSREFYSLCPVVRMDHVATSIHFQQLCKRLSAPVSAGDLELLGVANHLAGVLRERNPRMPIAERWHGDLVPWNTARDTAGVLWCWDWESSERDAVAGLDAVHWAFSVRRESGMGASTENLSASILEAGQHLHAAGLRTDSWADLAAIYALVMTERAWALARENGGWVRSWISPKELMDLMHAAEGKLTAPLLG
ncbi:hypothetical protein AOC05_02830 [Arthrobacter alpinus]|uniref:Aminoglycoside phosphotransferase domain-containing protein n=1 Tax=Arthrobacter alpinus TaxID=656366 RepID=A0A0M3UFK9_9MICC|nr:hypothetical protein [Arthrobacter alpinus]ALE91525.1 hypothetical protein AOC05_02830 [Arthrobacter alpinus]